MATRTAAGLLAPGRAPGVQTAPPETSSSGGLKAPPVARERTRMPGTITTRPPESGRHRRGGRTPGRWSSGRKSHPRRIPGSPRRRTTPGSSDVGRLGLASKALKTYLCGARNLRDPFVPLVSEDMSHVSNFRRRVRATSEKITPGVARKPPHIMPLRTLPQFRA